MSDEHEPTAATREQLNYLFHLALKYPDFRTKFLEEPIDEAKKLGIILSDDQATIFKESQKDAFVQLASLRQKFIARSKVVTVMYGKAYVETEYTGKKLIY